MGGAFLQSVEWEHVHQKMKRKTWRVSGILIVQHNLPRGLNYLYCARPVFKDVSFGIFLEEVKKIALSEKSLFFKIDPAMPIAISPEVSAYESQPLQPPQTVIMDLAKSGEELLAAMHEKTRYNIRLAERKDVDVIQVLRREADQDFETFWHLLSQTAERSSFSLHEKQYYKLLLDERTPNMSTEFFFAHMRNDHDTILAAAMINFYKNPETGESCATYLHGGSSREHKELMAPYLLHWRIMEEAKKRGMAQYDLWGIDGVRWPGVTRFKKGFGGSEVLYPPSLEVVYRPLWYKIYRVMKERPSKHIMKKTDK